jgi:hypothetical protein
VSHGSGLRFPAREGSDAAMCHTAPMLPRATRLWTSPSCSLGLQYCHVLQSSGPCLPAREGSGASMCHTALKPASLLGRVPVLSRAPRLRFLPPCTGWGGGGSGAVTCPATLGGAHALRIKKGLAATTCNKARVFSRHSRVLPRRLQDVWADNAIITYKLLVDAVDRGYDPIG